MVHEIIFYFFQIRCRFLRLDVAVGGVRTGNSSLQLDNGMSHWKYLIDTIRSAYFPVTRTMWWLSGSQTSCLPTISASWEWTVSDLSTGLWNPMTWTSHGLIHSQVRTWKIRIPLYSHLWTGWLCSSTRIRTRKHNFFLATRFDIEWDLTEPEALYEFITTECK